MWTNLWWKRLWTPELSLNFENVCSQCLKFPCNPYLHCPKLSCSLKQLPPFFLTVASHQSSTPKHQSGPTSFSPLNPRLKLSPICRIRIPVEHCGAHIREAKQVAPLLSHMMRSWKWLPFSKQLQFNAAAQKMVAASRITPYGLALEQHALLPNLSSRDLWKAIAWWVTWVEEGVGPNGGMKQAQGVWEERSRRAATSLQSVIMANNHYGMMHWT